MKRFRVPEIAFGILIGIVLALFAAGIGSYQASYCEKGKQAQAKQPQAQHGEPTRPESQRNDGHQQVSEHPKHPPYFGCGAAGLVPSLVGFMDSHEGFFVGSFTFVLALVTVWLVWTTRGLRESTDKLWEAGERQIKTSRSVGATQARNNRRQIKLAETTAERQLRAYVLVSKSEVRSFEVGKLPMPVIILQNDGQTPALEFTGTIGVGFVPFVLDELPNIPQKEIISKSPVGPGQVKYLSSVFNDPLTQEQWNQIVAGTHCIRAFGCAHYVDIFGNPQTTNFNKVYGGSYGANTGFAMNDAPIGNEAT